MNQYVPQKKKYVWRNNKPFMNKTLSQAIMQRTNIRKMSFWPIFIINRYTFPFWKIEVKRKKNVIEIGRISFKGIYNKIFKSFFLKYCKKCTSTQPPF